MNNKDVFNFYVSQILKQISILENSQNKIFSEIDSKLEKKIFKAIDDKDLVSLKSLYFKLGRLS